MTRKPQKNSLSFFKVLLGDFTRKLMIPPTFVKKFEKIMSKTVILKSHIGKSSLVSVKKDEHGYFFQRGWLKFVRDHDLQVGEFVVFNFVGDRTFAVVIYDRTCCKKDMNLASSSKTNKTSKPQATLVRAKHETLTDECAPCSPQVKKSQVSHETSESETAVQGEKHVEEDIDELNERVNVAKAIRSIEPKHPYFVNVFKDYQRYKMIMPKRFVTRTGLAKKKSTVIKDPAGRVWPVEIRVNKSRQVCLSRGLPEFVEANGLVAGDTCVFHFMEAMGNAIQVQVHSKNAIEDDVKPPKNQLKSK